MLSIRAIAARGPMPFLLPAHTGLRAVAALLVVCFHYSIHVGDPGAAVNRILLNGYLGVDLFFVLSGFIIHHVYRAQFAEGRIAARYATFLRYRLARIYPVHVAMLLVLVFFQMLASAHSGGGLPADYSPGAILAALALVQGWFGIAAPNGVAWSVSAEWFVYLVYPGALVLSCRLPVAVRIAVLCGLLLILQLFWQQNPLLRVVPEFALGAFAYEAALRLRHRLQEFRWLGAAVFAATLLMLGVFQPVLIVPLGFCFAALLVALVNPRDDLARVLSGPVALYLGEISYSLYMVHSPWREILKKAAHRFEINLSSASGMVLSVVTALALAALVYHTVEMPARHLLRGRKSQAPQDIGLTSMSSLDVLGPLEPARDRTVG